MNDRNKRVISILTIFTILFTVMGGSLAYWNWSSSEASRTGVAFTIDKDFSCSADGGGNITPTNISLEPSTCTNPNTTIKREVKLSSLIKKSGLSVNMDLWLQINDIDQELSDSENLRYVFTTSPDNCETGVVSSGTFNGASAGSKLGLINNKKHTESKTDTYYLWIWLDKEESNINTMNKGFDISLSGDCTDSPYTQPNAPVLDSGMIPVTIANDGTVTTISEEDSSWYDYENREWANVVLVNNSSRTKYLNTNNVKVEQSDILAYYVWIPRFQYGTNFWGCPSEESSPIDFYPQCWAVTTEGYWTISDEDKQKFIDSYVASSSETPDVCGGVCKEYDDEFGFCIEYDQEQSEAVYRTAAESLLNDFIESGINNSNPDSQIMDCIGNVYSPSAIGLEYNETSREEHFLLRDEGGTYNHILFESQTEDMTKLKFEDFNTDLFYWDSMDFEYKTHPAFWWDNDNDGIVDRSEMLAGIWVGKFETTGSESQPTVLPNQDSKRNDNVSTEFNIAKKISANGNIYGISNTKTNAHMAKSSEWGAVSILTYSQFGYNTSNINISDNNYFNNGTLTGCGGTTKEIQTSCAIPYGSSSLYSQSTTGNITGIFDMVGASNEHVMSVYNNNIVNSGFTKLPDKKYYDLYTYTHYDVYEDEWSYEFLDPGIGFAAYNEYLGSAMNARDGYSYLPTISQSAPWITRGGKYGEGDIFKWGTSTGTNDSSSGFRTVIINGFGE